MFPLGWQRMGDVDFIVPFVFSEDVTITLLRALVTMLLRLAH